VGAALSYTPNSEEIDAEVQAAIEALKNLNVKLRNRFMENSGGWNKEHREKCVELSRRLEGLCMDLATWD
jgi:hypothetical protein